MKREHFDKRKRKEQGGGRQTETRQTQREKRRGRREWGLLAPYFMILYWLLRHLYVFAPHLLVRNPLPVDVGIVGRTTSNIVFVVVLSLSQTCVSSD
jgi:hypothetical protein